MTTTAAERLSMLASTLDTAAMVPATQVSGIAGGPGHTHVWNEVPAGTVDGVNAVFTLAGIPTPPASLMLVKNGLHQRAGAGNDFTLAALTVTFLQGNLPQLGDVLLASYTT